MIAQETIFQALADPARLRIVETMKAGECAVGDIVERMEIHQSGVSRHLRILSEAGIVQMLSTDTGNCPLFDSKNCPPSQVAD